MSARSRLDLVGLALFGLAVAGAAALVGSLLVGYGPSLDGIADRWLGPVVPLLAGDVDRRPLPRQIPGAHGVAARCARTDPLGVGRRLLLDRPVGRRSDAVPLDRGRVLARLLPLRRRRSPRARPQPTRRGRLARLVARRRDRRSRDRCGRCRRRVRAHRRGHRRLGARRRDEPRLSARRSPVGRARDRARVPDRRQARPYVGSSRARVHPVRSRGQRLPVPDRRGDVRGRDAPRRRLGARRGCARLGRLGAGDDAPKRRARLECVRASRRVRRARARECWSTTTSTRCTCSRSCSRPVASSPCSRA